MEISYAEVEKIYVSLTKLTKVKFPIAIAVQLTRLFNQVETEYKIYSKHRNMLINEYAKRDENSKVIFDSDTNSIPIKEDFLDICNEQLKSLHDIRFKVDFSPISIDNLCNTDIQVDIDEINGLVDKFFI